MPLRRPPKSVVLQVAAVLLAMLLAGLAVGFGIGALLRAGGVIFGGG